MRPEDRKYLESHEWAKTDGETVLVGITDFAVEELSHGNVDDLVYCDLPEVGRQLEAGETFGEIESVKAVAEIYSPVTGEVVEVNDALDDEPELLNTDPYANWIYKVKLTDPDEIGGLMDAAAYEQKLADDE